MLLHCTKTGPMPVFVPMCCILIILCYFSFYPLPGSSMLVCLGSMTQFDILLLSSLWLFCSPAFAMMELCSVTRESVKVRKQSGESNVKSSWFNNPILLLPCFFLPSFSHPQRVVRVDAVFSLFTLCLPAAQRLPSRSCRWQ